MALLYGLSWPLQRAVHFDFHEIALAVPLIAVVIDAHRPAGLALGRRLLRAAARRPRGHGRARPAVAVIVLLRRKLLLAVVLAAMGVGGYLVATAWVIPAFSVTGTFAYWTYDSGLARTCPVRPATCSGTRSARCARS